MLNIRINKKKESLIINKKLKLGINQRRLGVKLIDFKKSTDNILYIQPFKDGLGFKKDYNPIFFNKFLNKMDFNNIITNINKIIEENYIKRKKLHSKNSISFLKKLYLILILLVIIGFILMEVYIFSKNNYIFFLIAIIIYSITGFFSLIIFLKSLTKTNLKKKNKMDKDIIYEKLVNFIKIENNNLSSKNLKIVWGENYFWLEFHKLNV